MTWCNGTSGLNGTVSAANSLIAGGPTPSNLEVTPLPTVTTSWMWQGWNGNRGAVTWCSGTAPTTGTVSSANSLVGDHGDQVGSDGVTALPDGNYVVASSLWNDKVGAVTWGNGTTGISGVVSAANSLVGSSTDDELGQSGGGAGITILANGNYVVDDPAWGNGRAQ